MMELNHNFDQETVKNLDMLNNYFKRLISEMLHINANDTTLNRKEDIQLLSDIYKNLCLQKIGKVHFTLKVNILHNMHPQCILQCKS